MLSLNSKMQTKCAAFWNHTNIRSGNRIYPCCRFKNSAASFTGDVSQILNSPEYIKLRELSENNEKISGCEKCYYEESLGKTSLRQKFNKEYDTKNVELKYLEVGFDNICNLACDGCWGEWSSTWAEIENPDVPKKSLIASTNDFQNIPDTIEKVVFLGGEPLMTNRHRRFLEKHKNLKNLTVEYFTNGMFKLTEKDHNVLKQCKSVKFTVSIDGVGKLNETVRAKSDWNTVVANARDISNHYNTVVHSVIHKNNWQGLPEMLEWTTQNSYSWTTNILTFPKELDIINLPNKLKNELISICNSYNIPNREYIQKHLQGISNA